MPENYQKVHQKFTQAFATKNSPKDLQIVVPKSTKIGAQNIAQKVTQNVAKRRTYRIGIHLDL